MPHSTRHQALYQEVCQQVVNVHISWFRRNASKHANLLHAQTFIVAVYMLAANEGMRQQYRNGM